MYHLVKIHLKIQKSHIYLMHEKQQIYLINMRKKNQYLSYYMHQNIKNAQYILENKMPFEHPLSHISLWN